MLKKCIQKILMSYFFVFQGFVWWQQSHLFLGISIFMNSHYFILISSGKMRQKYKIGISFGKKCLAGGLIIPMFLKSICVERKKKHSLLFIVEKVITFEFILTLTNSKLPEIFRYACYVYLLFYVYLLTLRNQTNLTF